MSAFRSVKGMHDVLPGESAHLRQVEAILAEVLDSFGYREMRLPLLEQTALFARSLGAGSDVVEKEMYSFEDHNGDQLSLRPEGTAGCVRAGLEGGILRPGCRCRLWYSGAFFRRERPQKGRYRQFRQVGAEAFGFAGADLDAELLTMTALMWERLGLDGRLTLRLNSLGDSESRRRHRDDLIKYLLRHEDRLDDNARRRIHTNPLRIFDSKDECTRGVVLDAPLLSGYLDEHSKRHFERLQELLVAAGVGFEVDEYLVRGLDYYTHTVFEWVVPGAGAQSTVCAGGRYDGLVSTLGGESIPAAGFAAGVERLAALVESTAPRGVHVYIVAVGERAELMAHGMSADLRRKLPGQLIVVNCGGGSFKAQMRRADKSGAVVALLIGEDEVKNRQVTFRFLRDGQGQQRLPAEQAASRLQRYLL